jgi:hypothetical protein
VEAGTSLASPEGADRLTDSVWIIGRERPHIAAIRTSVAIFYRTCVLPWTMDMTPRFQPHTHSHAPKRARYPSETNATNRPCAEIAGSKLVLFACWPAGPTEIRRVSCATRSRTNTSVALLVSPATRFDAVDMNATNLPSAEIAGSKLVSLASCAPGCTESRVLTAPDPTAAGVAAAPSPVPTTSVATAPVTTARQPLIEILPTTATAPSRSRPTVARRERNVETQAPAFVGRTVPEQRARS